MHSVTAFQDSYLDYLKSKYPRWNCSLAGRTFGSSKDVMMNRLAISDYNWDEDCDRQQRVQRFSKQPQLYQDIPNVGPFLMSDVARVRRRLKEIAHQLDVMRETRMNLTTEDYFRTRVDLEGVVNK
ncbi:unnamed protein product [Strongylus vulgaris]|uniref:Uncharacterized protein n=1 Tax=Strongylus vulgaris TaxID=40348 RepID=A0A3P7LLU4_STRVU|nr:unnamed protein product [Strongylus vulgaris]